MSQKEKNIKDYFKRHIKKSLLSVTWEKEGQLILFDKEKIILTKGEKQILKLLIAINTPDFYRTKLWLICSGAKKNIEENPNYYKNLVELSKDVKSLYAKQIEKDLKRSFKNKEPTIEEINKLREVLTCYSIRNSSIGYCQGFNFIVQRLLETLKNEENAFWVFSNIIEEILPLNYYSELCGVTADQIIIINFLKKYFPSLIKVFNSDELKGLIENFINQSLISIFIETLNDDTSYFIWDCFFLEGSIVLIKVFIAIIGELQNEFLKLKLDDFIGMKDLLDNKIKKINKDSIYLLHCLIIRQFEFTNDYLEKIRFKVSNELIENIENGNLDRMQINIQNKFKTGLNEQFSRYEHCNKDYPYCYNDSYFENVTQVLKYLILSPKYNPEIKENYFFTKTKNNNNLNIDDNNKLNLIVERRPHYCSEIIEEIKKERESEKINNDDKKLKKNNNELINEIKHSESFIQKTNEYLGNFNPSPFFIPDNENKKDDFNENSI